MVKEFLTQYGFEMIYAGLMFFFGFIGIAIKNTFQKYTDDKTKKDVALTVVKAMEQMYADWTGSERFDEAVRNISEMLEQKDIAATELEIKLLIEAAVKEMNMNAAKAEKKASKSKTKAEAK